MNLGLWAWKSLTCIQMRAGKWVSGTERKKLWPRTVDCAIFRLDLVVDQMEINIAEFIYTFISSYECTKSPPWSGYRSVTGHGTIMSSEDQKTFTLLLLDPQHQVLKCQCHRNEYWTGENESRQNSLNGACVQGSQEERGIPLPEGGSVPGL